MIAETDRLRLAAGVVLRQDKARDRWTLMAPERLLVLDETAVAAVRLCVGETTVGQGIDALAAAFDAPRDEIAGDVLELLGDLWARGFVA